MAQFVVRLPGRHEVGSRGFERGRYEVLSRRLVHYTR